MPADRAEIRRLEEFLTQIGAGLDRFLDFEHPDAYSTRNDWREALDQPLPQQGIGIDALTRELIEQVMPHGSPVIRPGFSGFIVTGPSTASVIASTAASVASPVRYQPTAFNLIEELSLDWLAKMFGLGDMKGVYSSGGSVANLIGLGAARQHAFEKIGVDPARDGMDRQVSIYASSECHHTIQRSGGVLGVGRRAVRLVECDNLGRMRCDALEAAIEQDKQNNILPMAIVANAGTTNTGAIDPLHEIGELARRHGIWLHIDGAYGLPGILDNRVSQLYYGLELADSVIVDPHKWLGATIGIAATFVRDRKILERAFTQEPADYLEGSLDQGETGDSQIEHSMDDFGIPYYNYGIELTSPCRGIAVWALLREIGVDGIRERIVRHNDMARSLADACRDHPNLELLLEPTLSICCFRFVAPGIDDLDRINQRLYRRLIHENEYLPSTTRVDGKLALRPCYISTRAEPSHVQGLLDSVLRIGDSLLASEG